MVGDRHRTARQNVVADEKTFVNVNPALVQLVCSRRVLMLDGPVGPFFDRLARWLMGQGVQVQRVVFSGGGRFDCKALEPVIFDRPFSEWPTFLRRKLLDFSPTTVLLFGQSRPYHEVARGVCKELGIQVVVTEEGYLRPGYMTMELDGVNGFSTTLNRYQWSPLRGLTSPVSDKTVDLVLNDASPASWLWQKMALYACLHYGAMWFAKHEFSELRHHRETSPAYYIKYWVRSLAVKYLRKWGDESKVRKLKQKPYYFVPLQHDGDAQIVHHSPYRENTEFILDVLRSFADHAPPETYLVFRQHPQARGGYGHESLIYSLAKELGVRGRVLHLVEGHTPTLVQHAMGVVVINSTVGLQALARCKPLKVMGDALYRLAGLSFMGPLNKFWVKADPPDSQVVDAFMQQVRRLTQVPCHVYDLRSQVLNWQMSPAVPQLSHGA